MAPDKAPVSRESSRKHEGKLHSDIDSYFPTTDINYMVLLSMAVLGLLTRLFAIHNPHYVVFDEVHFGKYASFYLRGEYFFDVHPPLGKLLVALSGWLVGYDGSYLFDKIGENYLTIQSEPVPYVALRFLPAVFGGLMVPLVYLCVIELGAGNYAAFLASALLLLDNSHVCQTRLILLDSYLIFFIFSSFYFYIKFRNCSHQPFTKAWNLNLIMTGVSLACAIGVKMVGLFIIVVVGIHTAYELWQMFSDLKRPIHSFCDHLLARVLALIVLPALITFFLFSLHIHLLPKSGTGDSHMSKSFQSDLIGNANGNAEVFQPDKVAYGSIISISNKQSKCYLHSHPDRWPKNIKKRVTSAMQQVTCYAHNDPNSLWMVLKKDARVFGDEAKGEEKNLIQIDRGNGEEDGVNVEYVKNNDLVQFLHIQTHTLLHSHDVASAVTPGKQEMSAWKIGEKFKQATEWRVTFKGEFWKPYFTTVQLHHVKTPTTMQLTNEKLPDFAFKQQEVVSAKDTEGYLDTWYVETNEHKHLKPIKQKPHQKIGILSKIFQLLGKMIDSNNNLSKQHVFASRPWQWPFINRGISFYQGKDDDRYKQIYFIGNPVAWWSAHSITWVFCVLFVFYFLRWTRKITDISRHQYITFSRIMSLVFFAWGVHYFPFFFMQRQLFLHHYLPTVVFIYIICGVTIEHLIKRFFPNHIFLIITGYVWLVFLTFILFAPMTYGLNSWGFEKYLKWKKAWDFKQVF